MALVDSVNSKIYIGTHAIAEILSWDVKSSVGKKSKRNINSTKHEYSATIKDGSNSIQCHYDPDDTEAQNALRAGETVALEVYPNGKTGGEPMFTGTVLIEEFSISGKSDEWVDAEISVAGVLEEGTVPAS